MSRRKRKLRRIRNLIKKSRENDTNIHSTVNLGGYSSGISIIPKNINKMYTWPDMVEIKM
jgi:hypothetical protein